MSCAQLCPGLWPGLLLSTYCVLHEAGVGRYYVRGRSSTNVLRKGYAMAEVGKSAHQQAMDRVSAMTEAGQYKPEYKDKDHERFATYSRVAEADGHFGHIVAD